MYVLAMDSLKWQMETMIPHVLQAATALLVHFPVLYYQCLYNFENCQISASVDYKMHKLIE